MKIRKAAWKISSIALALIFIVAGAVPVQAACTGVCSCHAMLTTEHHVHQAQSEISHGMDVRLFNEPQPLPDPLIGLNHHDHKTLIAVIQTDHSLPDWVAVTAYPLFGKDTHSTGNALRESTSADANPVPLYLQHLALIC